MADTDPSTSLLSRDHDAETPSPKPRQLITRACDACRARRRKCVFPKDTTNSSDFSRVPRLQPQPLSNRRDPFGSGTCFDTNKQHSYEARMYTTPKRNTKNLPIRPSAGPAH
ncbi:hypothetical protein ACHAP5_008165 [Fusarium lateritium]